MRKIRLNGKKSEDRKHILGALLLKEYGIAKVGMERKVLSESELKELDNRRYIGQDKDRRVKAKFFKIV